MAEYQKAYQEALLAVGEAFRNNLLARADLSNRQVAADLASIETDIARCRSLIRLLQDISLLPLEQLSLRPRFTREERAGLLGDGACIKVPKRTTILEQWKDRQAKGQPSFWRVDRLLALPSRPVEVAFFPNPERFFVEGTFGQDTDTQEGLVRAAGQALSKRLNLPNIAGIMADEAATWTDLTFQYLDETGVWLFGREYAKAVGEPWVYGRTKNPTNASGSQVVHVGIARPADNLHVYGWNRDRGYGLLGGPLLIAPV